ncbi:tetratricopeptide repeat protein [Hymenobacter crusticola]|uniref:Uncharacterized protein n=1 Tax=Hymenobacter crusticola TaxID=1770526 RepID=A0A243WJZ2_9BACT|nr:hypothetical protein [Hymenobacter crusticola]OUJ76205.1 hypothetical protein BXP70_02760 [Hymenobacter crusticola]
MRFLLRTLATCLLLTSTAYAQTNMAVLHKADDLVAQKKYDTAFRMLQEYDPHNTKLAVVLKKEEYALNYSIATREYHTFTFKDLPILETLDDNRYKDGVGGTIYRFRVGRALDSLKRRYPKNYKLDRGLGDYYFSLQQCDCAEKGILEDDLFPLIIKHYGVAHDNGYGDYYSYFAVGYAYQRLGQFKQSVAPFLHSIDLRKDFPPTHLNLAFVYLELKQYDKAREQATLARDQFQDDQPKSDAAFLLSEIEDRIKGIGVKTASKPNARSTKIGSRPKSPSARNSTKKPDLKAAPKDSTATKPATSPAPAAADAPKSAPEAAQPENKDKNTDKQ